MEENILFYYIVSMNNNGPETGYEQQLTNPEKRIVDSKKRVLKQQEQQRALKQIRNQEKNLKEQEQLDELTSAASKIQKQIDLS